MQSIKFRGKVSDIKGLEEMYMHHNNGWVYGNLIVNNGRPFIVGDTVESSEDYILLEYWLPVPPETVGQYSKVNDKNNLEIYEGDVLRYYCGGTLQQSPYIVKSISKFWEDIGIGQGDPYYRLSDFEIIGNIYDNPELKEV